GIDPRARIDALNDEAWPVRLSDRERAAQLAREALALAEEAEYPVGIALALRTLGVQRYYFHSDYDGGMEMIQRSLALLDEARETRGRADALNGIATVHRWRGEYGHAARLYMEALQLYRAVGDREGEGQSLNLLGAVAVDLGDYGTALEYYQESLALREQVGDRAWLGHTMMNLGAIYGRLCEPERALEYTRRAMQIHEHHDAYAEGVCLCNIGNTYELLGEQRQALEYFEHAATRFRVLGHVDEANCLADIARIHAQRGNHRTARASYLRALGMVRRAGVHMYELEILIRLGALECADGEAGAGLAHLREALALADAQGARQHVYAAHEALATAFEAQGDTALALVHHRAFHAVWAEVFGTRANLRIQNARIREEVRQTSLPTGRETTAQRWSITRPAWRCASRRATGAGQRPLLPRRRRRGAADGRPHPARAHARRGRRRPLRRRGVLPGAGGDRRRRGRAALRAPARAGAGARLGFDPPGSRRDRQHRRRGAGGGAGCSRRAPGRR
ncbi:MAG TPA: tetratricopeptide repeat protein, partial [Longimicrobium sp.]|nr:tetratricopeptide repeat protein [Longimicrobium sp.]